MAKFPRDVERLRFATSAWAAPSSRRSCRIAAGAIPASNPTGRAEPGSWFEHCPDEESFPWRLNLLPRMHGVTSVLNFHRESPASQQFV
jgi:hypothetical protein